jgi:hypothetical protein
VPRDHRQGSPRTSRLPDDPVSGSDKIRQIAEVRIAGTAVAAKQAARTIPGRDLNRATVTAIKWLWPS